MGIAYTQRQVISVVIHDPAADDQRVHVFKAPIAGEILSAQIVCQDAQGAGSAGTFQIENWGTAGSSVSGTIAVGLGGTAAAGRLSAETPAAYTITEGTLSAGDWVVIDYQEDTAWVETSVTISIEVIWGFGANA